MRVIQEPAKSLMGVSLVLEGRKVTRPMLWWAFPTIALLTFALCKLQTRIKGKPHYYWHPQAARVR